MGGGYVCASCLSVKLEGAEVCMRVSVCVCVCVCVQVTDEILEINGQNTENMLHSDAITVIKSGGNTVRLVIRRAIEDGYQGETVCSCSVCVCVCT